ncbi:aldehyde dehydrogenase family protein [Paenibacillus xylaniclasticus]|uniref:aldehyde dehydrogenase family protein n=1 Tax=Paenibacillus xylaniclasticus TaxID=588083 RepID=UPI000FD9060E|nr:aldehyde dehydrogenase [Paenibacillus xylaniclasticus]
MTNYSKGHGKILSNLFTNREFILHCLTKVETFQTASIEMQWVFQALEYYENMKDKFAQRDPIGTVYVSSPQNLPLYSFLIYVFGPALVGNKIVLRLSSKTANITKEIIKKCALDDLIDLEISELGAAEFIEEASIKADCLIFTGSYTNSVNITRKLNSNVKYIYNGSGNCSFVIGSDANIQLAVGHLMRSKFFNSGQDCMATERLYVHKNIYSDVINEVIKKFNELKIGRNIDVDTDIGEILSFKNLSDIDRIIDEGKGIVNVIQRGGFSGAYYVPCLLECLPDSPIVQQEKYGPILPVITYNNNNELLEFLSNDEYGLGITLFGFNNTKFINKLNYGQIVLNNNIYEFESIARPFGGFKRSGFVMQNGKIFSGPIYLPYETSVLV